MAAPSSRPLSQAISSGPVPFWHVLWEELLNHRPDSPPKSDYSDLDLDFQDVEIKDRQELAALLTDPTDVLALHLRRLSKSPIEDARAWLNSLLSLDLYDCNAFERVQLRNSTRHFLQLSSLADIERRVLNRHLLEDAFPDQLQSLENRRLIEVFEQIRKVRGNTTAALCLSGGGIRSATFSLGVIQALARGKILSQFDYLSTVSGGGYIGSWLSSWIHRHPKGLAGVEADLEASKTFGGPTSGRVLSPEPEPVRHLRSYSKYLSPRTGLFSADVWTLVAIVLRNLIIHWSVFLPILFALLALPRLCVSVIRAPWLYGIEDAPFFFELLSRRYPFLLPVVGLGASVWALSYIWLHVPSSGTQGKRDQGRFLRHVIGPLAVFAISITTYWSWNRGFALINQAGFVGENTLDLIKKLAFLPFILSAVVFAVVVLNRPTSKNRTWKQRSRTIVWNTIIVGAAGLAAGQLLSKMATSDLLDPVTHPRIYVSFAAPLFLIAFLIVSVVLVGVASRWMNDSDREWLARAGGWIFSIAMMWALLSSLVLAGPEWILFFKGKIQAAIVSGGGVAGLLYSLYKGFSARTPAVASCDTKRDRGWLLKIAALLAVVMIVVWISWATSAALGWCPHAVTLRAHEADPFRNELPSGWSSLKTLLFVNPDFMISLILLALALSIGLDLLINLNEFSLHSLYRNRLIRSYLGASRPVRRPNPFTGFDPNDDVQMSDLEFRRTSDERIPARQRPLHVVNASLNLVHGEELAWQQRKASNFAFTPVHCGNTRLGYRHSIEYARKNGNSKAVSLGTAVTISGAAVSPNMGYHSSGLVTFLLTLFNVRLGWWLGNPGTAGQEFYKYPAPRSSLWHLTLEALGYTDDQSNFVYLSDGGHFENLALYSMVERRCQQIVMVDAECDPKAAFEGLGNAIRKIQVDLGIPIVIDYLPIYARSQTEKKDGRYCAVGTVCYSKVDQNACDGTIIYLKPTLCGNEPVDVRNYAASHPDFPHETTGDQWFDETQFESYRKLGEWIASNVFDIDGTMTGVRPYGGLVSMVQRLRERWYAPSPQTTEAFLQNAAQVDSVFDLIRTDDRLRFMDSQIYPEWRTLMGTVEPPARSSGLWLPLSEEERRAGFYACSQMIQLMENVYLGLSLEEQWNHLDNRGWMNLFSHWTWSGMFRVTYAMTASTYGARFQSFCRRHLKLQPLKHIVVGEQLKVGELRRSPETIESVLEESGLNFLETKIIKLLLAGTNLKDEDSIVSFASRTENSADPSAYVTFSFGVAIIGQLAVEIKELNLESPPYVSALRYLRVQDHMRKMGLAKRALRQLIADPRFLLSEVDLIAREQLPADFPEIPSPLDYAQVKRLHEEAVAEMMMQKSTL